MKSFPEGLPLPHEPYIKAYGVVVEKCRVFKSSVAPIKIMFKARRFPKSWKEGMSLPSKEDIPAMVKNGDDMR